MLPYLPTFAVLVLGCALTAYRQHRQDRAPPKLDEESELRTKTADAEEAAKNFKWIFLPVYLLVMGSDWLQVSPPLPSNVTLDTNIFKGPYIYTLYKDEKGLEESVVAALFLTGFGFAAVSATFIGSLADKFGRRFACVGFCVIYILSCMSTLLDDLVILFVGRMLGGIATTLMYSVFESWMVTEYHHRRLDQSSLTLSSMFGLMTTLNSSVAIGAGLLGQLAVSFSQTKTSPFMASIILLGSAAWYMMGEWVGSSMSARLRCMLTLIQNENHGDSASSTSSTPSKSTLSILLNGELRCLSKKSDHSLTCVIDKRILVLGFISTCFEGSMYLFIFFWSAALKSAHLNSSTPTSDLPHGIIFASFMCSMMLGSLFFSIASALIKRSYLTTTSMLTITIGAAGSFLMIPIFVHSEALTLWCFCLYELCVGVYYPCMGYQKGKVIDDGVRAQIYGVLRIPLNIFVAANLAFTSEGDEHRDKVFLFCGGLLLVASVAAANFLDDAGSEALYEQASGPGMVSESEELFDSDSVRT